MTTTYYLLRTKDASVGTGPYLGHDEDGSVAIVPEQQAARRFDALEAAEQHAMELLEKFGTFEIEVRNSIH